MLGLFIIFTTPIVLFPILLTQGATPNFMEMSKNLGYPSTLHKVITEDGYILKVFHLTEKKTPVKKYPVLLMHGIVDTADTWILRGNSSLSITLANAGYDVWLGNSRGNKYSRKHIYLDPDLESAFWNFTFHEHGICDFPAMIDLILNKTGSKKLNVIGHSQGNTIAYVLGSMRPEYNKKVNVMISLAPVAYLHNIDSPLGIIFKYMPTISNIARHLNINEIFGSDPMSKLLRTICSIPTVGYIICIENFLFVISGDDTEEVKSDFFSTLNKYFPNSSSRKNLEHFAQLYNRRRFAQFDYGKIENNVRYNAAEPPSYDFSKVTMPVALLVGVNDRISTVKDVDILKSKLPNLINYTVIPRKSFNHLDDVWGENMNIYLFPYIKDILERHN